MRVFPSKRLAPKATEEPNSGGPQILRDGLLLGRSHILCRLADEMKPCVHYRSSLCVAVGTPDLLLDEQPSEEDLATAVAAVRKLSRRTDLVGWLDGTSVLIVMPETERAEAESAVFRWRNEIYLQTAQKWQVAVMECTSQYENPDELLQAATEKVGRRNQA